MASFPRTSINEGDYESKKHSGRSKGKSKEKGSAKDNKSSQGSKLRGRNQDSTDVRISKTISWLLRHAADSQGIEMRADGYVNVSEMLAHLKLKDSGLDLEKLQHLVRDNDKQRYDLILEGPDGEILEACSASSEDVAVVSTDQQSPAKKGVWLIRARQGHSIKNLQLNLKPILSLDDIPTKIAVHGTNRNAWKSICLEGLSRMTRNHVHFTQDVGKDNVISGMRLNSQILIYIDVDKAIDGGLKFWLSDNGVILSEGDDNGHISGKFFLKVVDVKSGELQDWDKS